MKMGDRRLKRLDELGTQIQRKVGLTGEPTNRAERRKFKHVLKQERVKEDEIDQIALFEALKAHYAKKVF
jgi:hypothetical protein